MKEIPNPNQPEDISPVFQEMPTLPPIMQVQQGTRATLEPQRLFIHEPDKNIRIGRAAEEKPDQT